MPDIRLRGQKLHYLQAGSGDAVLFVHGFTLDSTAFAAQMSALSGHYRCVAVDLWGHGESAWPALPWSWQSLTNDLLAFIRRLRVAPCHAVGHGAGGVLALQVALDHPELVRSLTLISTPLGAPSIAEAWSSRMLAAVLASSGLSGWALERLQSHVFDRRFSHEQPEVLEAHARALRAMAPEVLMETIYLTLARDDLRNRLGELSMPVVVLPANAAEDHDAVDELAGAIDCNDIRGVPAASRVPMIEKPALVTGEIARLLEKLASLP